MRKEDLLGNLNEFGETVNIWDNQSSVNDFINNTGGIVEFNITEENLFMTYYSGKLEKSVVIDWEPSFRPNTNAGIVDYISRKNKEAVQLERSIIKRK